MVWKDESEYNANFENTLGPEMNPRVSLVVRQYAFSWEPLNEERVFKIMNERDNKYQFPASRGQSRLIVIH